MADTFDSEERKKQRLEQYQKLLANQDKYWGTSPDKAADERKTAKQLGVPVQAVHDAPEYAAQTAAFQRMWERTEGLGTLRGKMTDPDFHALAQDDVGTLAKVGGVARSFADGAVEGAGSMVSGTGEILSSGWNAFTQGASRLLLKKPEGREHETSHYAGPNNFAPGWRFFGGEVKDFSNNHIDIPDEQKTYANEVAGGLGQLLTQGAVYLATGGVGALASGGAMAADQMAEEVRNDDAPQINKDLAVLGSAAFTAASEKVPLEKFVKGWRMGTAGNAGAGAVAKRIFMGGAAEAVQEGAESIVNDTLRKNLTKPDHEISMANALHGAAVGGGVGVIATSLFEGAAGMRRANIRRQQQAAQAEAQAEHLKAQSEQMAQSKLAGRAPDVAAEYVNELYGEQDKIYIDGEALQQSGMAHKVAELMPQRAGEFAEAAATGGMVELTRGDFHTVLNQPDIQAALLPHVRATPDAMTLAEAQALRESGEDAAMAEAVDEAAEAAQQQEAQEPTEAQKRQQAFAEVVGNVQQQLTATGRYTPEQARINATLAGSYYQATADRMGVPVTELFAQRPLNVVGESLTQPGVLGTT
ncbi:hypothetical protein L1281_002551 [Neisseria sp. HSC-16F19]|nr:hypothetical protein [Neisseria sp. HSC-16F19]MCP2041933.1 hypothetical protein [Neisseria sp. HSC-16F19]